MTTLALGKYEGLGNDFLVLIDPGRARRFDASLARALCDRHRGIGADGLIRLSRDLDDGLEFDLLNADGSVAETSGNGLRCAALAAVDGGLVDGPAFAIRTVGETAHVDLIGDRSVGERRARITMGHAEIAEVPSPLDDRRAFRVNVGNPHLVLIGPRTDDVDLAVVGPELERAVPGGQNVELVRILDPSRIALVVWERGAGLTEACGSGSVATGAAAWFAGLADAAVDVENPGGTLRVDSSGDRARPEVALTGVARRICEIQVDLQDFAEAAP